jgi:HEAT repeat protein
MVLLESGFGKVIGGAIAKKVLDAGVSGVVQKLSSSELEKALDFALSQAQEQAGELVPSLNADGQDRIETFLKEFLSSNICLEELQKPLKGLEKPDVAVLAIAFEQAAETTPCMKSVKAEQLHQWLQIFVETYFKQTNTFIRYRAKLREYSDRLITSCEDVKFVGIDVSAREDHRAARLLDIFVVPNVSEESAKSASSPERLLLERPEQLTERQAELWMEQRDRFSQERGRSMSAHDMLRSSRRRVVLLGDPGTGKTTLMRYLAVMAAGSQGAEIRLPEGQERLPILVYMRDWAKNPERSLLDQVRDFAVNTLQVELLSGFLEHWTEGQALLLLDGLDEVAEDATRADLVEKINCFLAAHENNWAVITSRKWGYQRAYFRTDAYPHFELELFNDEQIQEFIEHWYEDRSDNAEQAQEMVRDLQDALKSKDRLKNLVRNPLLLTMVALIHRDPDPLPTRRDELYDRAVNTLLKSWDRGKWEKTYGETYGEFKYLDRDYDLRRVISQLAYWIHTQYETQTTESGTVIEEGELLTQLSRIIRQEYSQVKPDHAKQEAGRFMAFIRDRTGLLNEYGRGRYAFVHKTFQEYLTAEAILNQAEYEDNSELIYEAIQNHLHNSHWREVLLLLVGQLQGEEAAKAIEVVLRRNSPYEQWLHRDLLFAGHCLTEDPEKLATAAPGSVSEILQRLVTLETDDEKRIGKSIKKETYEIFGWLKETAFELEALTYLKASKEKIDRWRFLDFQSKLGEKEIALTILTNLLKDENPSVRSDAAEALCELGDQSEFVLMGLLNVFLDLPKDGEGEYTWFFHSTSALKAVGNLGNRSEFVLQRLLKLLKNDNASVRYSMVEILRLLGNRSEIVSKELVRLLKDEELSVRYITVVTLDQLGDCSGLVLQGLHELYRDKNSYKFRSDIAKALMNLGDRSEFLLEAMLEIIKDYNLDMHFVTAKAWRNLGDHSRFILKELLELLQDSCLIISRAVIALKYLGVHSELVLSELLKLLKNDHEPVRYSVVEALEHLDDRSDFVLKGLLELFNDKNETSSYLRSRTAKALMNLGDRSDLILQGFSKMKTKVNRSVLMLYIC